ncbi:MAG TPA: hypothetical protein VLD39_06470 [Gammaproteobacteria bacterium]|nr:hypothetical protein [Gammaproteobacteria bacterium]
MRAMTFYLVLLLVNVACFMPLYVLNAREKPNPLEFLTRNIGSRKLQRLLYARPGFTDPLRINFDFTFPLLLCAAAGLTAPLVVLCLSLVLAFGFVEILYASIMTTVFKRPPSLVSDLSLVRAGFSIVHEHRYWIVLLLLASAALIAAGAYAATALLFKLMPDRGPLHLIAAAALLPPCTLHWRRYAYSQFLGRAVYSPILHLIRNLSYSRRWKRLGARDAAHFDRHNHFKDIELKGAPNLVLVCIESYGSIVYRDCEPRSSISGLLGGYMSRLAQRGLQYVSSFSEPPIFAGGSWLSYVSFTYGFKLDDLQYYEGLFGHDGSFAVYESLFHVLRRNGYRSAVLCPLTGVDPQTVDWASIKRCFQADELVDFRKLEYRGAMLPFLGWKGLSAAPDQYALNSAYEQVSTSTAGRFSLFFCTLNSHYPWHTAIDAVADWRSLNRSDTPLASGVRGRSMMERYRAAIRYQLDYILQFAVERADEDLLIVIFGDHQPPIITPEKLGKHTPVHIIGKSSAAIDVFRSHGFLPTLDLSGQAPRTINHEAFLSLFMKSMQTAYGTKPGLETRYRPTGVALLEEP